MSPSSRASSAARPTRRERSLRSRTSPCARRVSSQNPALAISASMAAMRVSFEARSKMPPEVVEPSLDVRELAPELARARR